MTTALFTVKATISPDREKEFNEWYNHTHIPDVMKFGGVVSARRYKAFIPEDRFQYIAVYEFESRETLERFIASDHMTWPRRSRQALRRRLRATARGVRAGVALAICRGRPAP